jgi:outer membrane receptor protein involved in Fe transport
MFKKRHLCLAVAAATAAPLASQAQQIEEVVVTATKRAASTQDVPIRVAAITQENLENMGVENFTDMMVQLPGVTAGGSGPGQNTVYIRGVASTTPNLATAGVAGLAPNVAFYLDEQPLAQPGRNLDVYAADINRVEVLAGPQGTLFGASSQAGLVRMITNKPEFGEFYGRLKGGLSTIKDGEASYNTELMLNMPVSDNFALRAVLYQDDQGGYVDNVPGTIDLSQSARYRPAGTVRDNGVVVTSTRAGFQATEDISGINFVEADNSALVEEDFNDSRYTGARVSGLWEINPDWQLLVSHTQQKIDSDGVFFSDPDLGEHKIQRYSADTLSDDFHNTAVTLEGLLGDLEVVYAGAYTDRETEQVADYTDYLFVGQYLPYYICDYAAYAIGYDHTGTNCYSPDSSIDTYGRTKVQTHELRFSTNPDDMISLTAGLFYSDFELAERVDFLYGNGSMQEVDGGMGYVENYPYQTGFTSLPGPFPEDVGFRNDVLRTDEQLGVFGEATFDLTDDFDVVLGARYYDIEVDMEGSANASFCNRALFFNEDSQAFGTDISDLYNGDGEFTLRTCAAGDGTVYTLDDLDDPATPESVIAALGAPDKAKTSGTILKLTGNWTPSDNALIYGTVSEGFRPGLLNRPGGAQNPAGTFTVPYALQTDEVVNYEIGWKTDLFDYSLRFNGAMFWVDIENLQTTIFDPSVVNLFFSDNAANAEVKGFEGDFIWMPVSMPGLTVSGAVSILDTEITQVLTPTDDVRQGDSLAYAPELQANLQARYEWDLDGGLRAHVMPHVAYSDESYSDVITINRARIDSWYLLGVTAGVTADTWSAELYVDNLTDQNAQLANNFVYDRMRVTFAQPRTVGMRVSYDF